MTLTEELLPAARNGDHEAFRRLVEPVLPEVRAHCYRMLGSVHDADDAVQDALLRAWRALDGYAGRGSFRGWLYAIATNACLAMLRERPVRVLPTGLDPDAENVRWLDPYPSAGLPDGLVAPEARYELRESIELAFVAALQHLPPRQRAVLVLRDVLGFSARETGAALGMSVAAVNSSLQRAHAVADERLPERSQQATLRSLGDDRLTASVDRYVEAWEAGDVPAIVALLADDARFAMPPYAEFYTGHDEITAAMHAGPMTLRWRLVRCEANGQVAFGTYYWDGEAFVAGALDLIELRGREVADIVAFIDRGLFERFGLPAQL